MESSRDSFHIHLMVRRSIRSRLADDVAPIGRGLRVHDLDRPERSVSPNGDWAVRGPWRPECLGGLGLGVLLWGFRFWNAPNMCSRRSSPALSSPDATRHRIRSKLWRGRNRIRRGLGSKHSLGFEGPGLFGVVFGASGEG